jgi:hypothetical protein
MTLILSGTDGLSDIDGTASTPAIRGTDANTGMFFPAADTIAFAEGGVEAVRFDSSGNVGVGVTPSAWDTTNSVKAIQNPAGAFWNYANNNVYLAEGYFFNGSNRIYSASSIGVAEYSMQNGTHIWASAASGTAGGTVSLTERARIDSSGNFMVGRSDTGFTSGQPGMLVLPTQGITFTKTDSPNLGACMYLHRTFGAGTGNLVEFAYDTVVRGSISTNGTGVTYGTASDYRLKENVQPMTGALAKVSALKPCTYKWKVDASDGEGFIAHELAEVVPDCVTGEKDAVDADGNPVYQGIDTSFLVATLTAGLQEAVAMIEELKAKVAALEAKG